MSPSGDDRLRQTKVAAVLDVLLRARDGGEWLSAREIGQRGGTDYFPFYRGRLEQAGWTIDKRPGRTPAYQLASAEPDIENVLPQAPRPSLRAVTQTRLAAGLPADRCDFCLRPQTELGHALQVDHAQPEAYFGTTSRTRWLLACRVCNTTKRTAGCRPCPNVDPSRRTAALCDTCWWGAPDGRVEHTGGQPLLLLPVDADAIQAIRKLRRHADDSGVSVGALLASLAGDLG